MVLLWDVKTGQEIATLQGLMFFNCILLSNNLFKFFSGLLFAEPINLISAVYDHQLEALRTLLLK